MPKRDHLSPIQWRKALRELAGTRFLIRDYYKGSVHVSVFTAGASIYPQNPNQIAIMAWQRKKVKKVPETIADIYSSFLNFFDS